MMGRHISKIRTWEEVIIIRIGLVPLVVGKLMSWIESTSSRVEEGRTEEYNKDG